MKNASGVHMRGPTGIQRAHQSLAAELTSIYQRSRVNSYLGMMHAPAASRRQTKPYGLTQWTRSSARRWRRCLLRAYTLDARRRWALQLRGGVCTKTSAAMGMVAATRHGVQPAAAASNAQLVAELGITASRPAARLPAPWALGHYWWTCRIHCGSCSGSVTQ